MYSVLLVDDEKIIREGIYELLSMADLDLQLTAAASAVEAISIMEERRIDIVLTDICMPQMSGMELYDVILEKWPHCKMIFLTGHLEFEYVYKVHQHARYVLKAEEDSKIVDAVKESVAEIENDLLMERVTEARSKQQQRNKYYERMLLLKELVDGTAGSIPITRELLAQMDVDIDPEDAVHVVMIRCAALRQLDYQSQFQIGERICLLIEKHFLEVFRGTYFGYNKNLTYLLLQPRKQLPYPEKVLEGISETFQKAVSKNLGFAVSIYVGERPSAFPKAISDFSIIRDRMVNMAEDEILIENPEEKTAESGSALSEEICRELSRKNQQLDHYFDSMDRESVTGTLRYMREQVKDVDSNRDLFVLELYFSVIAKVLSYVKKVGFSEDNAFQTGVIRLYNIAEFSSWEDAFDNLCHVVHHVFAHVDTSMENKYEDVINNVKLYIDNHLDGDTSLYALSTHVHLCQEHLLRVFKKQEGVTVLQYINDLKLAKAKQMLSETDMQIKEIATKLGFTSSGYFGRFFKSKLGVTPNVYRDQKRS